MKSQFSVLAVSLFFFCSLTNAQWVQIGNSQMTQSSSITFSNDYIFVGTADNGIFRSSDNGDNWEAANNGLSLNIIESMANNSGRLFASTFYEIISSTDNGNSWDAYHDGLPDGAAAYDFLFESDTIYASGFGVYFSSDNGANWIRITSGLPISPVVRSITRKGNKLFAATFNGVFVSEDNGLNWSVAGIGLSDYKLWSIITSGNNILAGTDTSGIFISFDDGQNWAKLNNDFAQAQVRSFVKHGGAIYAGFGFGWGVYKSTDDGITWAYEGQGLPPLYTFVIDLQGNNNYLFAAGGVTGFFRRQIETTEIGQSFIEFPLDFSLAQNYPNPFNPSTKISWQSPISSRQTLKVYDVLGNEVATLVDEYREAGRYEVEFRPESSNKQLASGIYFYKLQASTFVETRKMILLK